MGELSYRAQAVPLLRAARCSVRAASQVCNARRYTVAISFRSGSIIHAAAFFGRVEIVEALLAAGADTIVRNNNGSTALDAVSAPFESVKPIYDYCGTILGPAGLTLD